MQETTLEAVRAIFRSDPSISPQTRGDLVAILRAGRDPRSTPADGEADRLIRRSEAARLLARSPRSVDHLAAAGVLRRVLLPGRSRSAGFRLSDVRALIASAPSGGDGRM